LAIGFLLVLNETMSGRTASALDIRHRCSGWHARRSADAEPRAHPLHGSAPVRRA